MFGLSGGPGLIDQTLYVSRRGFTYQLEGKFIPMAFFVGLHLTLVPLIWLFGGLGTIWGIVLLVRKRGIDRLMRILLGVTAGLGILQALIGGILYLFYGARPSDPLHFVYGLIVLIGIPVAFTYADNKPDADKKTVRRDMIVFTIAIAAVAAAAVRAFMTGCPPIGCPLPK